VAAVLAGVVAAVVSGAVLVGSDVGTSVVVVAAGSAVTTVGGPAQAAGPISNGTSRMPARSGPPHKARRIRPAPALAGSVGGSSWKVMKSSVNANAPSRAPELLHHPDGPVGRIAALPDCPEGRSGGRRLWYAGRLSSGISDGLAPVGRPGDSAPTARHRPPRRRPAAAGARGPHGFE
jgi:hypothetical protein